MIHVFVTAHASRRFPGKNRLLAPYSIVWLLNEAAYMEEPVQVYTVGDRAEFPFRLPAAWRHVKSRLESHRAALELAEAEAHPAEGDVCALVQLTQPLREHGLLERAVSVVRRGGYASCITASPAPREDWRCLDAQGGFGRKVHEPVRLADGQLYAWQPGHVADIFSPEARHGVVITEHRWGVVDINEPGDMPPALAAMAGELLFAPMNQPPLRLHGRSVLLIGSGEDLVGRGLGKRIDAREWDVVARCNHFYGDPADVGTRTDLAVVRAAKLERAFFDEAPCAPLRVVSTNDGNNFPLNMVLQAAAEVGHKEASCGVIAAKWLLSCGAHVTAIGIGHRPDGSWAPAKSYPDGTADTTTFCDWDKEHRWWERQQNVTLL